MLNCRKKFSSSLQLSRVKRKSVPYIFVFQLLARRSSFAGKCHFILMFFVFVERLFLRTLLGEYLGKWKTNNKHRRVHDFLSWISEHFFSFLLFIRKKFLLNCDHSKLKDFHMSRHCDYKFFWDNLSYKKTEHIVLRAQFISRKVSQISFIDTEHLSACIGCDSKAYCWRQEFSLLHPPRHYPTLKIFFQRFPDDVKRQSTSEINQAERVHDKFLAP